MTALPEAFLTTPIAHRALHDVADGRPENSLAAVRAAIAGGCGIEIDVQLSADGAAMVFHDYALDRLTEETGPVRQRAASALAAIPLIGGLDGIPDLPAVLALVAGQVPVLVEIKDQDGAMGPGIGALEEAVAIAVTGYAGPLALMSFNPHSATRLAALCPDQAVGLVTCAYRDADWPLSSATRARLREIPDFESSGASFISHEAGDLDRPRVADLKVRGVPVLTWTIRSPEEEAAARRVADNITFEGYLPVALP